MSSEPSEESGRPEGLFLSFYLFVWLFFRLRASYDWPTFGEGREQADGHTQHGNLSWGSVLELHRTW